MENNEKCVFCEIIKNNIPSTKVYEDDEMIIIKNIAPKAKIHLLLIPKTHYAFLSQQSEKQAETLGRCLNRFAIMSENFGLNGGYRIAINQGKMGGQSVFHLHVHILGGQKFEE